MSIKALRRTDFSEEDQGNRGVALILGESPYSTLVAQDLQTLGFQTYTQEYFEQELGRSLGPPENAGALEAVSALFKLFAALPSVKEAKFKLVHPGVSFWAERTELVSIADQFDLFFLAPPPSVMRFFSNRLSLLELAEKIKIPHLVYSFEPVQSVREFEKWRKQRSIFPVVLKSTRSTRGLGVMVFHSPEEIQSTLPFWLEQLQLAYKESMLIIEKYKEGARKIAIPFLSRRSKKKMEVHFFAPIDRSLHSRTSPWVDVCPAPSLDIPVLHQLHEWVKNLIEKTEYVGFGQCDFLVDGPDAFLIDASARLTECFPLVQRVSQARIVEAQLQLSQAYQATVGSAQYPSAWPNKSLDSSKRKAIAFRVLAEDVMLQMPCPGRLDARSERTSFEFSNAEAKVHYVYQAGEVIPSDSEGILAYGEIWQNNSTIEDSEDYQNLWKIAESVFSELWFAGLLRSSEGALRQLAAHPWVRNGSFHSTFIDEEWVPEYEGVYAQAQLAAQASLQLLTQLQKLPEHQQLWIGSRSFSVSLLQELAPLKWKGFFEIIENRVAMGVFESKGEAVEGSKGELNQPLVRVVLARKLRHFKSVSNKINLELKSSENPTLNLEHESNLEFEGQIQIGGFYFLVRFIAMTNRNPVVRALTTGTVKGLFYLSGQKVEASETLISMMSLHRLVPHRVPIAVKLKKWCVQPEQEVLIGDVLAQLDWLDSDQDPKGDHTNAVIE